MVDWLARLAFDGNPFIATTLCEERIRGFGERAIAELRYFSKRECRINFLSSPLLFSHTVFALRAVPFSIGNCREQGKMKMKQLAESAKEMSFPSFSSALCILFLAMIKRWGPLLFSSACFKAPTLKRRFDGENWFNKARGRKLNSKTCFARIYLHPISSRHTLFMKVSWLFIKISICKNIHKLELSRRKILLNRNILIWC